MKFLVTGSSGFIGMHVSIRLLEQGNTVIGYDNMNSYYDIGLKKSRLEKLQSYKNFSFYKADLENKDALFKVFEGHSPEVVINLAAQAGVRYSISNPQTYVDSNITGFLNILEACRTYPVQHLLFASSSSVYGSNAEVPFSIKDRVDKPVSFYAATKKSNELMAYCYSHLFGVKTTGLRFFTVYGPYGRPDMALFMFTKAILSEQSIDVFNYGDMWRDFTFIDDIVTGVILLVEKSRASLLTPQHYVYNIGNHSPVRLLDFIGEIESVLGKAAKKNFLPLQQGDVPKTFADISELISDTGFKPDTSISEGVCKFVDWYKKYYIEA